MFKKKLLNKAIMATVLGGIMLAPNFALAATEYKWDMQTMTTLGTTTTIVAAKKTTGTQINVYEDGDHYTLNGKSWMGTANKVHLYYGYDKLKGEVVGKAIAPMQAKGTATNSPGLYFTLKASDLPNNYTVADLDGIFQKLLGKYVNIKDTSNFFYKNCILQLVDDNGNQLYVAKFDTVEKVPHYLAISAKTFYETDLKDVGNSKDKAFVVGTAQEQPEVALGKSSIVTSETIFKLPTANTLENDGIIYGIFNDKQGKISGSGGKLTLNAGSDAAPDRSIGIYAGNSSDYVSEVNLSFDDAVSITAGRYGLEAGKNGKITVSGAESGTGGMSVKTVQDGYAVYAHDGGVANVICGGSTQLHLGHTTTDNLPANGAMLYAEKGGVINVDSQGIGKMQIKLGGLIADTAKALTDDTGIINLKMSGSGGTLQVNADGNVNITLAGGNTWEGTAAGNTTLTGGNKSMWNYNSADAQHLAAFTGAKTEGYNAFVTMADGNVAIDKYAGNGLFFFVSGSVGSITITSADVSATGGEANSLLNNITKDTLYFDSANVEGMTIPAGYENVLGSGETARSVITLATTTNLTDSGEIKNLLTGLADKLVYTGAAGGEANLDVRMAVVDSTAVNANIKKFAVVSFDAMGNKTLGELQTPETPDGLHVQILGGGETGSVYTAYTTKDKDGNNVYTFDKDLIINRYSKTQIDGVNQADINCPFWSPIFGAFKEGENFATVVNRPWEAGELNYTVDMQGHKLTAKNFYETGRTANNDRATIVALAREGSITFNNVAGMDLEAVADYYYTAAINVTEYSPNNIPVKGAHITVNNLAGWDNAVKATSYLAGGEAAYAMDNYIIFADGRNLPKDTPKNTLTIDIANLVDVDATKGQFGITAWGRGATINVGGGRIVATSLPALSTAGATCELNFNVLKDAGGYVTGAGNNPVQIMGDIKNNTPWYGTGGVINLGLNTADSYFKGFTNTDAGKPLTEMVADMYSEGTINMWVGNGAQWINTGVSHVNKLVGGTTAGVLDMTDAKAGNVTIDSYSGNMVALYKHKNDGDEPTDYSAGNITIGSATEGSSITLMTDNTGITDVTKADRTLAMLAGKLVYSGHINSERNLVGHVAIAEGLTAASATLSLGEIVFAEETGQGTYKNINPPPLPPTEDSEPVGGKEVHKGIFLTDGDNMVINNDVETTYYSDSYFAAGIAMMIGGTGVGAETHLTINGKVTMGTDDEHPGVVAKDKHGAYNTYKGSRWTGAGINMNQGHGSTITVTKGLEIYADGHGIVTDPYYKDAKYADKDLAVVTVNGPTTIHVGSAEEVGLYALANYGGTININMVNGHPGQDKVDINGNAIVMKDTLGETANPYFYRSGEINLALTTADSLWTGAVDNTGTTQVGDFNLYLQNGGTWNYQPASRMDGLSASTMPTPSISYYGVYDGVSHIAKLTGGSDAASRGVIMINSDDTLAIANYSGNVLVAYEHDEDAPATIYGGDIKIAKAKVGSVITLFTNNVGVDGSNYTAVLNALAGKLYYTGGDEALIGQVQIGEGLTSPSMTYEGYIAYGANGQGKYTSEKGTTVVETPIGEGTGEGAFKVEETDDAKTIKMDEKPKMVSVATGSALKNSGDKPLIIDNPQATLVLQSADKTSPVVAADKGDVKIKGAVEVIGVPGQKLMDVAAGKKMDLAGGEFTAVPDPENPGNPPVALELAKNAVVSIGMPVEPAQSGALAPKPLPVKLTGDVKNTQGILNLNLCTSDSFWKGNYQNDDAVLNLTIDNKDAKWEGKVNGATLNVDINAGTWVNKGKSESTSGKFTLKAGGVKKAFIDMTQESDDITIDKYSGGMTLIYNNEESTPTTINGGTVTIKSATENSVVNLWTDGKGLDLTTEVGQDTGKDNAVKDVLNALAKKLTYEGYNTEGHITGEVGVGEALTRPAITFPKAAALVFVDGEDGKGSIDASTFKDNIPHGEVVYGDSETAMMRGAKMAMASTAMVWRAEANDLTKRMGDLQLRKEEAGVWAKYYSGRQEYNNNGSFSNKYKAVQFGVDKTLGHGWLGGIALSYDDGSGSLNNGGRADNKVQSLGFYGTKVNKNGEYIDLIGKFSRLENEYTVYNDYGYSLDGDYKNFGMSVSAEYGKHINLKNGLVLTPAVEFTLGRVNSKNYDAYSEYYEKSMTVKQDAFNSAIGRIGVSIGKETATYSYYAKLGLAHEFAGGFDTTYSAPGEPTSGTSVDFKDTWKEVQVGGSVKLKNDALLYGSFSKSFGGDVKEKWRIDAGMMFTFNHISDFFGGRKKTEAAAVEAETPTANLIETTAPVEEKNYTAETAAVADANGDRNASVKVGDTEVGATMPASKISKGAFMLDEYVVTASRTKQRITDAKADVSVVTRTEIEAMHMNSVEEVLRTVPGVQFNNYGSGNQMNANISSLRINGSKDVALLVDGVKINDFQGVGEAGNMYAGVLNNMNNIERVEVLRGAAGVLYGSGAKGGVINIITREITENKTIADASVGSFGRKDTKFSTMGKAGKLTYNFSQGTFKQGDVTDGRGEKWEGHTNTHNFGGKVTYSFTDNHKLTLDYMDINSNFGGTDLIYSNFYSGKYDSTMWSIRDDWQINKNWSNTFVYRQNEEKRQHQQQYFAGNVLKNSDTDFKYTFISDQISFHNNRHNLVMGVDYSQGEDQNYTLVNGRNVKREMKNTSFYISEDWTIVPHVTLSGGLRHDRPKEDKYGSKIDSHTTKSYKLAWDVTKKDTVYAGRSEYFILPSMSQLYDKQWGNEGLKPAEGRTESIGYNKKFDDNNFLTVNYFQTKEDCGIGWNGYNRVNTSGISRGWNAQFTSRLSDKWSFNVGWSHLFEHSDGDDNYTLGYYPRDLATFGVYYNVGKFDAGFDGYWFFRKMDYSGKREFPADNYGIYNLSMNYKPTKNMKMYCKVENIFNKYYAEHTDAGTDPYLTGTGERKYYAMPGRAFMVGLEFNF